MTASAYTTRYLEEAALICRLIDQQQIDAIVEALAEVRAAGGRVFVLGVGGGAANASHAVNDFRKIVGIEAYAPTDNVAELTARVNDDGWETVFERYLRVSHLSARDLVFVLSVGGGDRARNVSANIVAALEAALAASARIVGIVGRDGGYTRQVADAAVVVPTVSADTVTPHTEAFQTVIWHLIVSHPRLRANEMSWESRQ